MPYLPEAKREKLDAALRAEPGDSEEEA
jgi:hypothetical protein